MEMADHITAPNACGSLSEWPRPPVPPPTGAGIDLGVCPQAGCTSIWGTTLRRAHGSLSLAACASSRQAVRRYLQSRCNRARVLHVLSECVVRCGMHAISPQVTRYTRNETRERSPVRRTWAGDRGFRLDGRMRRPTSDRGPDRSFRPRTRRPLTALAASTAVLWLVFAPPAKFAHSDDRSVDANGFCSASWMVYYCGPFTARRHLSARPGRSVPTIC